MYETVLIDIVLHPFNKGTNIGTQGIVPHVRFCKVTAGLLSSGARSSSVTLSVLKPADATSTGLRGTSLNPATLLVSYRTPHCTFYTHVRPCFVFRLFLWGGIDLHRYNPDISRPVSVYYTSEATYVFFELFAFMRVRIFGLRVDLRTSCPRLNTCDHNVLSVTLRVQ